MGGSKPHLLTGIAQQPRRRDAASTTRRRPGSTSPTSAAGRPWVTRLPFPVHVVERVETARPRSAGNRFVTRYAYHHGYFDGVEREFRGFGMVEQWDTEEIRRPRPAPAALRRGRQRRRRVRTFRPC